MTSRRNILLGAGVAAAASVAAARVVSAKPDDREHRLVIQVSDNRPEIMNLALNNAANVSSAYAERGADVMVEIVAYGPGLHMLRADTSPVKDRLAAFHKSMPNVALSACGNTIHSMEKSEGITISLLNGVKVVDAGVLRLMELQEQGWSYIRV